MYTNTFVECHTYVNLGQTQKKQKKPMTGVETTTNNTLRTGRF